MFAAHVMTMTVTHPVDTEVLSVDPLRSWTSNERNHGRDIFWPSNAVIWILSRDHINNRLGLSCPE
jgi:hypothetical protein